MKVSRGIDHIVHAVRDLDEAVALYRRAGFQVGARNVHPAAWGTMNHIVQLSGTFIEILGVADTSGMAPHAPHAPRQFSFGAFTRDFLASGEGLSMLVLEGRGVLDADDFRARGIGDFEPFEMAREARRPDGTPIKVAFTLAFAADPRASETGFFTCQHKHPENFWNPAFQTHPNGAAAVAGVVAVAHEPERHGDFLQGFADASAARATDDGLAIDLARGQQIEVIRPDVFEHRYWATPPDLSAGLRLAAIRFAGPGFTPGRQAALGAMLIFEPSY